MGRTMKLLLLLVLLVALGCGCYLEMDPEFFRDSSNAASSSVGRHGCSYHQSFQNDTGKTRVFVWYISLFKCAESGHPAYITFRCLRAERGP
jgi:hypothetical protein